MFVTNHALAGALIGQLMPGEPLGAFVVGAASHLALDAVPHWGCDTWKPGGPDHFLTVARRDGLLGLGVMAASTILVNRRSRLAVAAGMAGAVLLDLDKPLEHFLRWRPFPKVVQRVHERVQRESPKAMPNELFYGLILTLANVIVPKWPATRVESPVPDSPA